MPSISRRRLLSSVAMATLGTLLQGCTGTGVNADGAARPEPYRPAGLPRPATLAKPAGTAWFAPEPPVYPIYSDLRPVEEHALGISQALEAYIKAWLDGTAPAELPEEFLPDGTNRRTLRGFRLVRPEEITPDRQWAIRPAEIPMQTGESYRGFFPDPACTYIVCPALLAPFGAKLVIEGEFPRARFFDIQVTPSFEARTYRYDAAGVGEVPIVDVDIEPVPGHTNPFRIGSDRDASKRSYRVEYAMQMGNPVALNQAFRPPHFRARGNSRVGGAIVFRGPWGLGAPGGDGRGAFAPGEIWIRYYRPDDGTGPEGGVRLPRAWSELADGRRFWIEADYSRFVRLANRRVRPRATAPEPTADQGEGPDGGWYKQAGIFRAIISGIARGTGWANSTYVLQLDRGVAARGSDLAPPNNYEQSSTSATYIDYLVRGMSCGRGKVVVLTGRLPTFPDTGRGGPMTKAQMRYWSIVGYAVPEGLDFLGALSSDAVQGVATHAVRDDQLVLDDRRDYVIVLSRPEDRPDNATAGAGVTWVDWGPAGKISWTNRWLSVGPEWKGSMVPTPEKLGRRGEWGEPGFDPAAISRNTADGLLGEYLPRIGYFSKASFEALGPRVRGRDVPVWT
jgi:hypothetical protein